VSRLSRSAQPVDELSPTRLPGRTLVTPNNVSDDAGHAEQVRKQVQHRLDRWGHRRNALPSGRLGYQEAADVAGLLAAPGEGSWSLWTAPRSMREVENEVLLQLHASDLSTTEEPE